MRISKRESNAIQSTKVRMREVNRERSKRVREPTGVEEWERRSGSESEGSGSESERSGWVIMQHFQIAQNKKIRDGDTNKNSGPDRSTSGSASTNSDVLYPATLEQEHACTIEPHAISLPELERRRGIHLQRHIRSGAGHQTIGSFNVSESLMWSGIFLNQIQLWQKLYRYV